MTGLLATTLTTKLTVSNLLDGDDIRAIQSLPIRTRNIDALHVIVADGDRPAECCLLTEGFAFRAKTTFDGQRQVLSMHIPGEIPDLQSLHLKVMDHDLTSLTRCTTGFIPHDALRQLNRERPNVAAALWRETLIDAAIFREWIVNVGRRSAAARMTHLLIELYRRLEAVGLAKSGAFELPITQSLLGDCLALSTVHVNRVLQDLRGAGLLTVNRANFQLLQQEKLEDMAGFDGAYLHQAPSI
ncbi:Crp/Fnr family transcriptional regulator [Bradyrhizobium neotropicale]|uniref:Crp/Fnr family transcriptional regulator n=1 Tax=Bradyrhizobium neotropicale TaxID=1497615 RepID=UPI001AD67E39|nr:Crp/Fnr family transcriptional regulator [Bradyrhizobium neotropicale]MBO4222015.1 helix-turn-helix domain-containing protein [Bradyrhizobium neotropicale]